MHRGKRVVIITNDPFTKKRKIVLDTDEGRLYSNLIKEANRIEAEIERLLFEWNEVFPFPPKDIEFPLSRKKDSGISEEFYLKTKSNTNTINNKNPIKYKDQVLRSKNELIAFQTLEEMGYECKTEVTIIRKNMKFTPDGLIRVPEVGKALMLEIDGAMEKPEYCYKASKRKNNYYKAGFKEFKDVIFYRLTGEMDFDVKTFKQLFRQAVELNADDLI